MNLNMVSKRFKSLPLHHPTSISVFLYLIITLVFTYPLIGNIGSEIPQGRGDVYQAMANIESRVVSVTTLSTPDKLVFFAKNIGVHLPYVILNLFFNKYVSYNLLFLSSFVLSALGAYLLAFYFTKNRYAAFLAGLIYAFSPFHFYQSTVVNLGTMHQEWIPFLVLVFFRFFEKLEIRYFVAVSIFAFLIALNEHQMLAFSVLFMVMIAAYKIWIDRSILKNRRFWAYVTCSIVLLATVAIGMFGGMLKVATSDNNYLDAGENAANKYSIKVLDPIMPPVFHSIWGTLSVNIQEAVLGDSNRGSYFIGLSVLATIVYFAFRVRKKLVPEADEVTYRHDVAFWSISSLLFYLFSLGNSISIGTFVIYLPYYLIYRFLPFYENIRTTGRMFVFVMLGISVLFSYGFIQLLKEFPKKKLVLTGIFSFVILLEFWAAPIAIMSVSYSPFYDTIAKDAEPYSLIEIPGSTSYEFASYAMMTDVVHKKAVLNGMPLARKISGQFDMQQETPIIKQLLYTIPKGNDPDTKDMTDILKGFDWSQANDILNYHHVRYITVSKLYATAKVRSLAETFITNHIAVMSRYEDRYLIAYEVVNTDPKGYFFSLGVKNDQISTMFLGDDLQNYREIGNGAGLKIVDMGSTPETLTIRVRLKGAVPGLTFGSVGDTGQTVLPLDSDLKEYSFVKTVQPGENIIPFSVHDASGTPVSISTTKKKHQAALVTNITIESK